MRSIYRVMQCAGLVLALAHSTAHATDIHSRYRLLFVQPQDAEFDPSESLLEPSRKSLAREQIKAAMASAGIRATGPILAQVGGAVASGQSLPEALLQAGSALRDSLRKEIRAVGSAADGAFPVYQDQYLLPWPPSANEDLFYGADKITVEAGAMVNVLGVTASSPKFGEKVTEQINALITEIAARPAAESTRPVELLGLRAVLFATSADASRPDAQRLTLRVLLALKPRTEVFAADNKDVTLTQMEVPTLARGRWPVASLEIEYLLGDGAPDPVMHATFGDFEKFDEGNFVVNPRAQYAAAPGFNGTAKKGGGRIVTQFRFTQMDFNLKTLRVSSLTSFLRPGIKIGGTQFVGRGLHFSSIDGSFQAEFNSKIESAIADARAKGLKKLEVEGMNLMTSDAIVKGFDAIFGSRTEVVEAGSGRGRRGRNGGDK